MANLEQKNTFKKYCPLKEGIKNSDIMKTTLSKREKAILKLQAEGKKNRTIAKELGLNEKTVSTYILRARQKAKIPVDTNQYLATKTCLETFKIGELPIKKHFAITDNETMLGVFEYTNNAKAESLIMQIICEHYGVEDCNLKESFKIENYQYKPYEIKVGILEDWREEPIQYEFYLEQIGVYSSKS